MLFESGAPECERCIEIDTEIGGGVVHNIIGPSIDGIERDIHMIHVAPLRRCLVGSDIAVTHVKEALVNGVIHGIGVIPDGITEIRLSRQRLHLNTLTVLRLEFEDRVFPCFHVH